MTDEEVSAKIRAIHAPLDALKKSRALLTPAQLEQVARLAADLQQWLEEGRAQRAKGQKRPTDTVSNAARVVRIATGEEEDRVSPKKRPTPPKMPKKR